MTGSHSGSFKSLISVWFGADISARVITSRPSDHEGSVSSFTESHGVIRNIASSWMLIVLLLVNLVRLSVCFTFEDIFLRLLRFRSPPRGENERRRHVFLMVDASKAVCLLPSTQDPPSQDPLLWLSLPGLHGNRPLLNDLNTLAHTRIPDGLLCWLLLPDLHDDHAPPQWAACQHSASPRRGPLTQKPRQMKESRRPDLPTRRTAWLQLGAAGTKRRGRPRAASVRRVPPRSRVAFTSQARCS